MAFSKNSIPNAFSNKNTMFSINHRTIDRWAIHGLSFAAARWPEETLLAAEDGELEESNERDVEVVGERGGVEAVGEEAREDGARQ